MGNGFSLAYKPEVTPHPMKEPQFDSNFGFPNGRKERGKFVNQFSSVKKIINHFCLPYFQS